MSFIDDLRIKQDGAKTQNHTPTDAQKAAAKALPSQKDIIMEEILRRSGLNGKNDGYKYKHLNNILDARNAVSNDIKANGLREDDSVVGAVTELICEIGLKASVPRRYGRLPDGWNWFGDFAITGLPFNLYISVKSYSARERLIVSGTGQGAAPVIGYGLFDKPSEWAPSRVEQYKHRGFVAIYIPRDFYHTLASLQNVKTRATDITNIYGQPLLRSMNAFVSDIKKVVHKNSLIIDISAF